MKGNENFPQQDSLVDRGLEDNLDEGYSPMDRQPASHRRTTTEELRRGDSWDERLQQEEPDTDPYARAEGGPPEGPWSEGMEQDPRSGRLVAPDEGAHEDEEKDVIATDVGIDGGAASAEEAAMHVVSPEE